jgi:hypothetical protein
MRTVTPSQSQTLRTLLPHHLPKTAVRAKCALCCGEIDATFTTVVGTDAFDTVGDWKHVWMHGWMHVRVGGYMYGWVDTKAGG